MRAQLLSHVRLCATLLTVACQVPLSMRFSRQEYRSGLLCSYQYSHYSCYRKESLKLLELFFFSQQFPCYGEGELIKLWTLHLFAPEQGRHNESIAAALVLPAHGTSLQGLGSDSQFRKDTPSRGNDEERRILYVQSLLFLSFWFSVKL